jgi:tetratricopeptide (TPR) repeat protein
MRLTTLLVLGSLECLVAAPLFAQPVGCGDWYHPFGPLDYRTATPEQKVLVERVHFTQSVESLTKGRSGSIGGDLRYTLRAFPNHPRALIAMSNLFRKTRPGIPADVELSLECWFARAIDFRPEDSRVRVVYVVELLKDGHKKEAIEQLNVANDLAGDYSNVHYHLGFAFFDLHDYDKSLEHAKRAYELGFPLPGLRDKLKRAGKWQE